MIKKELSKMYKKLNLTSLSDGELESTRLGLIVMRNRLTYDGFEQPHWWFGAIDGAADLVFAEQDRRQSC